MMDRSELRLYSLKITCQAMAPATRHKLVSNIKDWVWGDIEGTFDYAIKHNYIKNTGKDWLGDDLWQSTEKLKKYDNVGDLPGLNPKD